MDDLKKSGIKKAGPAIRPICHVRWSDVPQQTVVVPMSPVKRLIKAIMPEYSTKGAWTTFTRDQELDLSAFLDQVFKEAELKDLNNFLNNHNRKNVQKDWNQRILEIYGKYQQYKSEDSYYDPDGIILLFLDDLSNKVKELSDQSSLIHNTPDSKAIKSSAAH